MPGLARGHPVQVVTNSYVTKERPAADVAVSLQSRTGQKSTTAVKVTGEPVTPGMAAVALWIPTLSPRCQETAVVPSALVSDSCTLSSPPPAVTSQVTTAPDTGLPNRSATRTTSGSATSA